MIYLDIPQANDLSGLYQLAIGALVAALLAVVGGVVYLYKAQEKRNQERDSERREAEKRASDAAAALGADRESARDKLLHALNEGMGNLEAGFEKRIDAETAERKAADAEHARNHANTQGQIQSIIARLAVVEEKKRAGDQVAKLFGMLQQLLRQSKKS